MVTPGLFTTFTRAVLTTLTLSAFLPMEGSAPCWSAFAVPTVNAVKAALIRPNAAACRYLVILGVSLMLPLEQATAVQASCRDAVLFAFIEISLSCV